MLEQTPSSGVPVAVLFLDSPETETTGAGPSGFEVAGLVEDIAETVASGIGPSGPELVCRLDPDIPDIVRGHARLLQKLLTDLVWGVVSVSVGREEVLVSVQVVEIRGSRIRLYFEATSGSVGDVDPWDERVNVAFSRRIDEDVLEEVVADYGVERPVGHALRKWVALDLDVISPRSRPILPSAFRGRRVLVVDDSAAVRELLRDLLESWSLSVTVVPSARAALTVLGAACAKGRPYDLLIVDEQMPDVPGKSLARILAEDARLCATPVLWLVTPGSPRPAGHAIGIAAEVRKPVRRQTLFGRVLALLRR